MTLLVFAHKKEAQTFLEKSNYKPYPFVFKGLYRSDKSFLLISGPGTQNATEKITATCQAFGDVITQVVNLGVAGALDDRLSIDSIYSVRTCFQEITYNQINPISHRTSDDLATVDCITTPSPVEELEVASQLAYFAPMVDMEVWALGSVSALFDLPFYAYKIISDRAGVDVTGVTGPASVIKKAPYFSAQLFTYCKSNKVPF